MRMQKQVAVRSGCWPEARQTWLGGAERGRGRSEGRNSKEAGKGEREHDEKEAASSAPRDARCGSDAGPCARCAGLLWLQVGTGGGAQQTGQC